MPFDAVLDVRITDSCLRDGSHAKRHQFTEAEVRAIVTALDGAGVPVIEVSHGDGLAGSSFTYGFSGTDERQLVAAAVGFLMMAHSQPPESLAKQARIMADAGCQCVYVVDSAGAMVLDQAADRVAALVAELGADAQVG